MRTHGLSALLPPLFLLLSPVGCDPDCQGEVPASSAIRGGEAPASIEPRVDAFDAAVSTFEIQTARSSASFTVEEEFLASARKRLGIDAGITHTTGVTRDVAGSLKLRVDRDAVTVLGAIAARLACAGPACAGSRRRTLGRTGSTKTAPSRG